MKLLKETIEKVKPTNKKWMSKAQEHLDNLTKPQGSLGYLEEIAKKIVAIFEGNTNSQHKKVIFTFAGDHGIAEEGVSAFPKDVTAQMVFNFIRGGAGINVLARHSGAEVVVVDVAVDYDFGKIEGLLDKKIIRGTKNFLKQPAMTLNEAIKSIEVGIECAIEYCDKGYSIFGTGDMGIGNTTPSSAITALLTGKSVSEVTGKGTGITDDNLKEKISKIESAINFHKPDVNNPIEVLSRVGGAEIGAIAGLIIGVASHKKVVLIDGFISTAGALIAYKLQPFVRDYIFASHRSVEKGHISALELMNLRPILDLDMRLGEGTGSAIAMFIIEAGIKIYKEMATFSQAGVSNKT
ncbi:MAG TPA: nicotinate-nucleotide--dimethylbenzimidazole phosphoribosyltransferase [Nitrospirae bacterium]|nr:nicotinate-nucleotide--dimethylbenzimidazole phosphoribosyltransferase [Nitrospirota bacterium]